MATHEANERIRTASQRFASYTRRIAKRNVERLKAFHARGDLKAELVSALAGAPASADGLAAIAEGSG